MKREHETQLKRDLAEVSWGLPRLVIRLKLFVYFFQRPIQAALLRRKFDFLRTDKKFQLIDRFLLEEGGTFKTYTYKICDNIKKLKDSTILVPGAGVGGNLFQLAYFKPKKIIAFDLYEYSEEWEFVKKTAKDKFGVDIEFRRGDFDSLDRALEGTFDFIISDAVLEHVKNMDEFMKKSFLFLKPGGVFFSSFGPLWFGPGGDHVEHENPYFHLLVSEEEYKKDIQSRTSDGTFNAIYWLESKLFSFLKLDEYFESFFKPGFKKLKFWNKSAVSMLDLIRGDKELGIKLDKKGVPIFDRYSRGMLVWLQKQ